MKELANRFKDVLGSESSANWHLLQKVSEGMPVDERYEFSYVGAPRLREDPFELHQGYLSIKGSLAAIEMSDLVRGLAIEFAYNGVALANLYILVQRMSYPETEGVDIRETLLSTMSAESRASTFDYLISSLNNNYYAYHQAFGKVMNTAQDWLDVFHSARYFHPMSDPLMPVTALVRKKPGQIDFKTVKRMGALLRASIFSTYGFTLNIRSDDWDAIANDDSEIAFVAGYLLDQTAPDDMAPLWLNQQFVDLVVQKHWNTVASIMFVHAFGVSYRNKNENALYAQLRAYMNRLLGDILENSTHDLQWLETLQFPDGFMALFSLNVFDSKGFGKVSNANQQRMLERFLSLIEKAANSMNQYLTEKYGDPFRHTQVQEPKYQIALSYLLLLLITVGERKELNRLRKALFLIRPQFYGGFRAENLASNYSEVLILLVLSIHNLYGLEDRHKDTFTGLFKVLDETVFVPYIHILERDNEIWDPTSDPNEFSFDVSKRMINIYLKKIREMEGDYLKVIFDAIENIKIAEWPYERTTEPFAERR